MYYDSTSQAHDKQTNEAFVRIFHECSGSMASGASAVINGKFDIGLSIFSGLCDEFTEPEDKALACWCAGVCARSLRDWNLALKFWLRGVDEFPNVLDNWTDAACVFEHFDMPDAIIRLFEWAPDAVRESLRARRIIGMAMVATGDYVNGSRWVYDGLVHDLPRRSNGKILNLVNPLMDLKGKSILVYGASGRGDGIQHCRSLKKLKESGASKVYYLDEKNQGLDPILNMLGVLDGIFRDEKDVPDVDACAEWHNLFYMYPVVSGEPYLDFGPLNPVRNRIGICSKGGKDTPRDEWRSIHVDLFNVITEIDNFDFISLNVNEPINGTREVLRVDSSYLNTADALKGLDLLITVDTSVAHLAGAMGVKTWLLVAPPTDWRWGISGEKSRWYDSVTIYRARGHKQWKELLDLVAVDLVKRNTKA